MPTFLRLHNLLSYSSPSPSVRRVTHALRAVKPLVNSGRPRVSRCSITRMEQSANCCQRHAVAGVLLSAFEDITVPIIIPLLTVLYTLTAFQPLTV